jgi:hypothetical protein
VQLNLNKVLQDIGVITRMEGVAVAEHRDSNLVDATPAVRSRWRANRHYPPDTPSAPKTPRASARSRCNSGSEHILEQMIFNHAHTRSRIADDRTERPSRSARFRFVRKLIENVL